MNLPFELFTIFMIGTFIIGAGITAALLYALKRPAIALGYVDCPSSASNRKHHDNPTPPIGGPICYTIIFALSLFMGFDWISHWYLLTAILLLLTIGIIDDMRDISSLLRLGVQIAAAWLLVVPGGANIAHLGNLLGYGAVEFHPIMAIGFSMFCMVLLINAMNMIDGLDGLSSGITILILAGITIFDISQSAFQFTSLTIPALAAFCGFFLMNNRFPWQKQAHVFFGDAGTLTTGCLLGWISISAYNSSDLAIPSMSLGWVLALPVMDAFALFTMRLSQKRSPFSADRNHLHHIIRDRGFNVSQSVLIIHGIHFCYGLIAVIIFTLPGDFINAYEWVFFIPWLVILATHTRIVFCAASKHKAQISSPSKAQS